MPDARLGELIKKARKQREIVERLRGGLSPVSDRGTLSQPMSSGNVSIPLIMRRAQPTIPPQGGLPSTNPVLADLAARSQLPVNPKLHLPLTEPVVDAPRMAYLKWRATQLPGGNAGHAETFKPYQWGLGAHSSDLDAVRQQALEQGRLADVSSLGQAVIGLADPSKVNMVGGRQGWTNWRTPEIPMPWGSIATKDIGDALLSGAVDPSSYLMGPLPALANKAAMQGARAVGRGVASGFKRATPKIAAGARDLATPRAPLNAANAFGAIADMPVGKGANRGAEKVIPSMDDLSVMTRGEYLRQIDPRDLRAAGITDLDAEIARYDEWVKNKPVGSRSGASSGMDLIDSYAQAYKRRLANGTLPQTTQTPATETPVVGDMVSLMQPTLHGPKRQGGRVTKILTDGRVEVHLNQGGYDKVPVSEVTKYPTRVPSVQGARGGPTPTEAPNVGTVQPGLAGMGKENAQTQMLGEFQGKGSKPGIVDVAAMKAREAAKPLPGQTDMLAGEATAGLKTRDSAQIESGYHLYGLGTAHDGMISTYHVTDNPSKLIESLKSGKPITDTRAEGLVGDLGTSGLYVSDSPQIWENRARGKWGFLETIAPEQSQKLFGQLRNDVAEELRTRYITQSEYDTAIQYISSAESGKIQNDVVVNLAGQPYNISFWKPEYLKQLGIAPAKQPEHVAIELRGKFADLSEVKFSFADERDALIAKLKAEGYDGAFVRASMGDTPQGVVWNRDAIVKVGDYANTPSPKPAERAPVASQEAAFPESPVAPPKPVSGGAGAPPEPPVATATASSGQPPRVATPRQAGAGNANPPPPAPPRRGRRPPDGTPPAQPASATPASFPERDRIIAQSTEQVRQVQPGKASGVAQKIPGVKQAREYNRPALRMTNSDLQPVHVAVVSESAAKADILTRFAESRIGVTNELKAAFGSDVVQGGKSADIVFLGTPAEAAHPATGKLLDMALRPDLYDLNPAQKQALANVQAHNDAVRLHGEIGYGSKIPNYPVPQGAAFLSTVEAKKDVGQALLDEFRRVHPGGSKPRSFANVRDRLTAEPGFKPEWNVETILNGMDEFKAGAAGGQTFRSVVGGMTKPEVLAYVKKNGGHVDDFTHVGLGIKRYFKNDVAREIIQSQIVSNGPLNGLLRLADSIRGGAFSGDFSPFTIQGQLYFEANPLGAIKSMMTKEGWQGFTVEQLIEHMKTEPDAWARYSSLRGQKLVGTPEEFRAGFMGKIPGYNRVNQNAYAFITGKSFDLWKANTESLMKANIGLTRMQAEVAASAMTDSIIPFANRALMGQSPARAALLRALPTSYSFIVKPAEIMTKATVGLGKLAVRKPLSPQERLAVKLMLTLGITTAVISVGSNAISGAANGEDVGRAALDAIDPDPMNGSFATLRLGKYRLKLGGPFRGIFRAVYPQSIAGSPFPVPFGGIVDYFTNRANPGLRAGADAGMMLAGQPVEDFTGRQVIKGKFPENILRGLEYLAEEIMPLSIGTVAEDIRHGKPENIATDAAFQIAGTNASTINPVTRLRRDWQPGLSEHGAIPSDPLEALSNYESRKSDYKSREDYRKQNPDVDAKLFITGQGELHSYEAADLAAELIRENKIDPMTITGIKSAMAAAEKRAKLGLPPSRADATDDLIERLGLKVAQPQSQPRVTPAKPAPSRVPVGAAPSATSSVADRLRQKYNQK